MPTTDPDKAYVKKQKINDMLNELYKSLVADKPDDPFDFALKYFESKVTKKEMIVPKIINEEEKPVPGAAVNPNLLLAKLIEKQKQSNDKPQPDKEAIVNLNVSAAAKSTTSSRVLSQYSIMNKVNRVFASQHVTIDTNEDILEAENFVITRQDNEDDEEQSRKKIIKYKNSGQRKDVTDKQRVKLLKVLTNELDKLNVMTAQEDQNDGAFGDDGYQSRLDEEESLISGNVVNLRRDERENDARHVRVIERKVTKSGDRVSRFMIANTTTPRLLCSNCQKLIEGNTQPNANREDLPQVLQQATVKNEPKPMLGGSHVEKTADALKSLTMGDLINSNAFDTSKMTEEANNIFDLLQLGKGKSPAVQKSTELRPLTKKDTARSFGAGGSAINDDDFIESASQVSGPRPIDPFEAFTNRSDTNKPILFALPSATKDTNNVMAWLLGKKQAESVDQSKAMSGLPVEPARPPSITGSNTSNRTLRANTRASRKGTTSTADIKQEWKALDTSGSERSLNLKKSSK